MNEEMIQMQEIMEIMKYDVKLAQAKIEELDSLRAKLIAKKEEEVQVVEKPGIYDISNDFTIKAFINSLPDNADNIDFAEIMSEVRNEKRNDKLRRGEECGLLVYALIKKYGFNKIYYDNIVESGYLRDFYRHNPFEIDYNKQLTLEEDSIEEYISTNLREYFDTPKERICTLISLGALIKLDQNEIKTRIDNTKGLVKKFIEKLQEGQSNEIESLYNYQDIQNGKFYKNLKAVFNEKFFNEESHKYVGLSKTLKTQIKDEYFQSYIKRITVYKEVHNHDVKDCLEYDKNGLKIYNDLAKIYDLELLEAE